MRAVKNNLPTPSGEVEESEGPRLDAHSEGPSGRPAEERIMKNDWTERSVNAPDGIAQFEKVIPAYFSTDSLWRTRNR